MVVIHVWMEVMLEISLYTHLYLKLAKHFLAGSKGGLGLGKEVGVQGERWAK
jgi:hypothetical protein